MKRNDSYSERLSSIDIEALKKRFDDRSAIIGVVGLGYVGLPFLVEKAKVGFQVIGIDRSVNRVDSVNRGMSYIADVSDADMAAVHGQGLVTATADFDAVCELDTVVICVPTPLDQNLAPDLQFIIAVAVEISKRLRAGQLISLESTTYPGTTEEVLVPILEQSGLKAGVDFFVAHSPERVDPGNSRYTTKNTNKVVGGINAASLDVAAHFYRQTIVDVVQVSSAKTAELVKVFENTFRAVNIALVNELALLCDRMDLDVWEVLDAAFTKPFGIMPFYPGPGVGGHCIPIDPHYLEWKAREYNFQTHFIALAGEINRKMPEFVVDKIGRILNQMGKSVNGSNLLLVGVTYKADVADARESPALDVFRLLLERGALVEYHDPFEPVISVEDRTFSSMPLTKEIISSADLVVITTAHKSVDFAQVLGDSRKLFDTRNATKGMLDKKIVRL